MGRWYFLSCRWISPAYRFGTRARQHPRQDFLGDRFQSQVLDDLFT